MKEINFSTRHYSVETTTNIEGMFNKLSEAKYYILTGYSDMEKAKKFTGAAKPVILGWKGEDLASATDFSADKNGKVTFKKTRRI